MEFSKLLKNVNTLKVLNEKGYSVPTEIQEKIIPLIIDGNDVLGQSQTGTGKTLAFVAPMLEKIENNGKTQALILAPTRELAIQISREIEELSKYEKISTTCVYGSSSIEEQIKSLRKGVEIVIGTPGRVKDLIQRRVLKLSEIDFFVLDEADEMLSMGFQEELEFIFEKTKNDRQVLLFSATMPKTILNLAKNYMSSDYKMVSVISDVKTAQHIIQNYYVVNDKTRVEAMARLMDFYSPNKSIIFCRTKRNADELLEKLSSRGYSVDIIHGDITQSQRIATLDRFKNNVFNYLIATDVAARGIHVDDIELVINYNLPESNEAYVHRIGRTGRANKKGVAVTLVKPNEERIMSSIERHINTKINKCEVPKMEDIVPNRLETMIEELSNIKRESKLGLFNDYLLKLDIEDMRALTNSLLESELKNNLGSDFKVSVNVSDKKKSNNSRARNVQDGVRVFMTIGKMDNIEKREFLTFIEKKAGIPEGACTGVEIMTKFTFMNIKNEYLDKVLNNCHNSKYNNRVIRIEIAKK
ncbi:MAG: DEAD/DEAH box helicase [Bacilli bacterium]|nr:DEAD/DEAH box helicase [Bacilli bacterium]